MSSSASWLCCRMKVACIVIRPTCSLLLRNDGNNNNDKIIILMVAFGGHKQLQNRRLGEFRSKIRGVIAVYGEAMINTDINFNRFNA